MAASQLRRADGPFPRNSAPRKRETTQRKGHPGRQLQRWTADVRCRPRGQELVQKAERPSARGDPFRTRPSSAKPHVRDACRIPDIAVARHAATHEGSRKNEARPSRASPSGQTHLSTQMRTRLHRRTQNAKRSQTTTHLSRMPMPIAPRRTHMAGVRVIVIVLLHKRVSTAIDAEYGCGGGSQKRYACASRTWQAIATRPRRAVGPRTKRELEYPRATRPVPPVNG
jgi:hypothetical protein